MDQTIAVVPGVLVTHLTSETYGYMSEIRICGKQRPLPTLFFLPQENHNMMSSWRWSACTQDLRQNHTLISVSEWGQKSEKRNCQIQMLFGDLWFEARQAHVCIAWSALYPVGLHHMPVSFELAAFKELINLTELFVQSCLFLFLWKNICIFFPLCYFPLEDI